MSRKPLAGIAALVVGLGLWVGADPARALELELPGERRLDIHGFYELRVKEFGEDTPSYGHFSLSQFRHVVSIETELGIFPEGIGPFDTMMSFTRWTISYECVYSRACSLFPSADSYGEHRQAIREPDSFATARSRAAWAGGVIPLATFPGTNVSTRQRITPGDRYAECFNPNGKFGNPFPLSVFCNLNARSDLDGPNDQWFPSFVRNRSGSVHAQLTEQLLRAARPEFEGLSASSGAFDNLFDELSSLPTLDAQGNPPVRNGLAQGLLIGIARAQAAGDAATEAALSARLEALSLSSTGVPFSETLNSRLGDLLGNRPDKDRFRPLDDAVGAGITQSRWGASAYTDTTVSWLTEMGFSVRPWGYFTLGTLDSVSESEIGLAEDVLPANAVDRLTGTTAADQDKIDLLPFYFGPDGFRNTADDLPIVRCVGGTTEVPGLGGRCTGGADEFANEPMYYVSNLDPATGALLPTTREECESKLLAVNANGVLGGLNANGECLMLSTYGNVDAAGGIHFGTGFLTAARVADMTDASLRPSTARQDPSDATDMRLRAAGGSIPARPPSPTGLYYSTAGLAKLAASSHNLVSNLDLGFTEDELKWEHGAGQDEHEFSEGYLETEFFDSQVFARVGKLIVVWGKTELFRNQDRINPVDIGLGTLSRLEESRLGQWAVQTIISPEMFMRVGPVEDLRLEFVGVFDQFEPTDLGECGEGQTFDIVCGKTFGSIAAGLVGIGVVGEDRPDENWNGLAQMDFGARIEGRFDRFTFAISDFWGWDDGLLLDVVTVYGRRVDPDTGAPVNSVGALDCKVRTVDGRPAGPDGDPATPSDNSISSVGNCLLFDNPVGDERQFLRASDAIALNHYANQTLFATVCTLTYDPDTGQCGVDGLNDYGLFTAVSSALGGGSLVTGLALDGYGSVRPASANPDDPFDKVHLKEAGDPAFGPMFGNLPRPDGSTTEVMFGTLTPAQQSLLGCGPNFLTACDAFEATALRGDPTFLETARVAFPAQLRGGVDLLNADASVVTQEFTILKTFGAGALVGTRTDVGGAFPRFEAGITTSPTMGVVQAEGLGVNAWLVARDQISRQKFGVPYADLTTNVERIATATDFQVEPTPWLIDGEAFEKGALVFLDPTGADRVFGTPDDNVNPDGENCTGSFGGPDPGCTPLEVISANIERLTMAGEIIGVDRFFDPPETFAEILAILDNNAATDSLGDPVAGRDGIRFNDFDLNEDGRVSDVVSDRGDQRSLIAAGGILLGQSFTDCLRAQGVPGLTNRGTCYLNIDRTALTALQPAVPGSPLATTNSLNRLVAANPVAFRLAYLETGGGFIGQAFFPWQELTALEMQQFVVDDRLEIETSRLDPNTRALLEARFGRALPETIVLRPPGNPPPPGGTFNPAGSLENAIFHPQQGFNVDANETNDLDENNDHQFDFLDDGTAGPITDDNILCGSGIPGDVLQFPSQSELDQEQGALLEAAGGLPPRSPLFCRGATALLNATAYGLPTVKAGGDGRFGRRDFLWHGGRQVAIDYQKVNVLGFSLDFAEDVTKTSWGIEFSASSDKLIPNVDQPSGYSTSNDFVLSISVDRPTFFNFLNPNRSFFVNFQFFMRYLDHYEGGHGGSDNKDGNFPAAMGPISGLVVLTMFTGYFQDRLNPSFSLVYAPLESNGGLLTGLGYRFTESFSTRVTVNHFFGHHVQNRASSYPIALFSNPDFTSDGFRGLAAVTNRDEIGWTVRYSF